MSKLLESITNGLRESHKRDILRLNGRIDAKRRELTMLYAERDRLVNQFENQTVLLADVAPADSLDQETADRQDDYAPSDPPPEVRAEHDRIDAGWEEVDDQASDLRRLVREVGR